MNIWKTLTSATSQQWLRGLSRVSFGLTFAFGFVFAVVFNSSSEAATVQAYSISSGIPIAGNQSYTGGLGNDFDVNSTIRITSLGAFDDLADGILGSIAVHIFDLSDLSSPLASVTITGSGDPLRGQFRFVDITPLTLGVGSYSVVAYGFGADDNANENVADIPLATNDGGGAISFVNSRFGSGNPTLSFPTTLTVGSADCSGMAEACFAAGSFEFSAVPLPAAFPLLAGGLGLMGLVGWRRRRSAAS